MTAAAIQMAKGATIAMLMEVTGWQAHSVRGFLSATVRKRLGLNLISETGKDGPVATGLLTVRAPVAVRQAEHRAQQAGYSGRDCCF